MSGRTKRGWEGRGGEGRARATEETPRDSASLSVPATAPEGGGGFVCGRSLEDLGARLVDRADDGALLVCQTSERLDEAQRAVRVLDRVMVRCEAVPCARSVHPRQPNQSKRR